MRSKHHGFKEAGKTTEKQTMTGINNETELHNEADKVTREDVKAAADRQEAVEEIVRKAGPLRRFVNDVCSMVSMLRDWVSRRYSDVPWGTITATVVALTYVFVPIDAIPDFIPIIGYLDDAAVVSLCLGLIQEDLEEYRTWQREAGGRS